MAGFAEIIGHEQIIEHLQNAILSQKVSHAYILNGPDDSGKKMIAEAFAMALQCEKHGTEGCMECHSCKQAISKNQPDIIYVKNFSTIAETQEEKKPENADKSTEVKNLYFKKEKDFTSASKETELQEVKKSDFKKEKIFTSGSKETELQEVKEFAPNYTNYNQTYMNQTNYNHTEESYNNPINQSATEKPQDDVIDSMDDAQAYIELIKENINYDHHMKYDGYGEKELYDELFGIICEVVCVKRKSIRVAGEDYPYELVKSRFLKLNSSHLEYVIGCMKETTTKITNIKAYMITALYNAPTTINHFYQQEVQHDMYGGGWHEKGII